MSNHPSGCRCPVCCEEEFQTAVSSEIKTSGLQLDVSNLRAQIFLVLEEIDRLNVALEPVLLPATKEIAIPSAKDEMKECSHIAFEIKDLTAAVRRANSNLLAISNRIDL